MCKGAARQPVEAPRGVSGNKGTKPVIKLLETREQKENKAENAGTKAVFLIF